MVHFFRHIMIGALLIALSAFVPSPARAAPASYNLDTRASKVEFAFVLGGGHQKGTMPVSKAAILVDRDNLAASRVDISLDVSGVRTPLPFVKPALVGPQVLDAARFPTIRFVSTKITLAPDGRLSDGARITGNLTIHGVTRPETFTAGLFRAPGSAPGDLSKLTVNLSGQVSRSAYGATGFSDLVGDVVTLNIKAVIKAR